MAMISTIKTKEEFTKEMNERISICKNLLDVYNNIYLPTLKEFDGKVYNIRFIKALRAKVENNKRIYISKRNFFDAIEIQQRRDDFNYNDYECLTVVCGTNKNGRISYNGTLRTEFHKDCLAKFNEYIEDYQKAIDNYDACIEQANQLANAINAYNDLPYSFRQNVEKFWLTIH